MDGDKPAKPAETTPETPWTYNAGTSEQPSAQQNNAAPAAEHEPLPYAPAEPAEVDWTASEFVDHQKSITWYAALVGITLVVDVILYFWTHDFVSITGITIMAILFGVVAGRKPRVLEYRLDSSGLTIAGRFHPYAEFKSFAPLENGALLGVTFLPLKRFMPPVSVFYAPEDQEKIMQVLAQHLPLELRQPDAIDRLSHRIRF